MILGRTSGGKIQIKQDPLRAVNCACCGVCYEITIPIEYDATFRAAGLSIPGYYPTSDGETEEPFQNFVEDTSDGWKSNGSVAFIDEPDGNLLFVSAEYIASQRTFLVSIGFFTENLYGFVELGGLECCTYDPCALISFNIHIGGVVLEYEAIFLGYEGDLINEFNLVFN